MNDNLPPVIPVRLFTRHEDGWSDQYGALQVAAAYAGLPLPMRYSLRGIWQHGCFAPWQDHSPGLLCFNAPKAHEGPVWVARQDQATLLRQAGYTNVQAIGLPIVYTPDPAVERAPGSLLIVPTHTMVGDVFADRTPFERYADELTQLAAPFSRVTVCVHPSCRKNGLWEKEFTDRGFKVIFGAANIDRNALLRMRWLFARYETVTTNGWGSHVAYALAFGSKVSIHGTQPRRSTADILRDTTWAADPATLKRELDEAVRIRERDFLRDFLVPPAAAVANPELGRWLIGDSHRLPPAEMAAMLAKFVQPVPGATADFSAQLAVVRRQAGELAAAGRTLEATQLLLRLVQSAVETKQPRSILEALTVVSADLAPLDPVKAAYLREQAQKLSARIAATP